MDGQETPAEELNKMTKQATRELSLGLKTNQHLKMSLLRQRNLNIDYILYVMGLLLLKCDNSIDHFFN